MEFLQEKRVFSIDNAHAFTYNIVYNLNLLTTTYCGFMSISRQNIPMENNHFRGVYKVLVRAYNALPFPEGARGRKGPGAGEPARRRDLRAVLTENNPMRGILPSCVAGFIRIIGFRICALRRVAVYIARVPGCPSVLVTP